MCHDLSSPQPLRCLEMFFLFVFINTYKHYLQMNSSSGRPWQPMSFRISHWTVYGSYQVFICFDTFVNETLLPHCAKQNLSFIHLSTHPASHTVLTSLLIRVTQGAGSATTGNRQEAGVQPGQAVSPWEDKHTIHSQERSIWTLQSSYVCLFLKCWRPCNVHMLQKLLGDCAN